MQAIISAPFIPVSDINFPPPFYYKFYSILKITKEQIPLAVGPKSAWEQGAVRKPLPEFDIHSCPLRSLGTPFLFRLSFCRAATVFYSSQ